MLRRLLVAGGGASFPAPQEPEAFELTAASAGGWIWFTDPRAVTFNGHVYFAYARGDNGAVCVRVYAEATETVGSEITLKTLTQDDHNGPSLLVRESDHKLLAFYCQHDTTNMYMRVSVNSLDSDPTLSGGFGSEATIFTDIDLTYPYPIQLTGETDDPIYLFYRDITSSPTQRLAYRKSTDGGSTWGSEVIVYSQSGRSSYWKIVQNDDARIDFVVTDGHPAVDSAPSTYHFYYEGGSYFKSDGSSAGSPTLDTSDLTLIASGATTMTWIEDAAVDVDGNPYAVWIRYATAVSDLRYMYGRWTGSAWDVHEIASAGASISAVSGSNYYSGGIALDKADPSIVYASLATGTEIHRYRTNDGGASWSSVLLDSGSKRIRPICPLGRGALHALWMAGTYTSFTSYSIGTRGARTA